MRAAHTLLLILIVIFDHIECSQNPKKESSNFDIPNRPPRIRIRPGAPSPSGMGPSSSKADSSSRAGVSSLQRGTSPSSGSESSSPETPASLDSQSSVGSPKYLADPVKIGVYDFPIDHNLTWEEKQENLRIHHRIEPKIPVVVAVNKHGDIYGLVDAQGGIGRIYQNDNRKSINKNTHMIKPFEDVFKPAKGPL